MLHNNQVTGSYFYMIHGLPSTEHIRHVLAAEKELTALFQVSVSVCCKTQVPDKDDGWRWELTLYTSQGQCARQRQFTAVYGGFFVRILILPAADARKDIAAHLELIRTHWDDPA